MREKTNLSSIFKNFVAVNSLLAVLSTGLLVADWRTTRNCITSGYRCYEKNVILGKHPSKEYLDAYSMTAIVANLVAGYFLPPYLTVSLFTSVAGVEAHFVKNNLDRGFRITF